MRSLQKDSDRLERAPEILAKAVFPLGRPYRSDRRGSSAFDSSTCQGAAGCKDIPPYRHVLPAFVPHITVGGGWCWGLRKWGLWVSGGESIGKIALCLSFTKTSVN